MEKDEKRKRGRLRLYSQPMSRSTRTESSHQGSDALLHGFLSQINKHSDEISVYIESQDDKSEENTCKKNKNESFQSKTETEYIVNYDKKGTSSQPENRALNDKNTSNMSKYRPTQILKGQKSTIQDANFDDSLSQDFKTPKFNQRKVQSKLTYLKEQKLTKVKKKSDSISNQNSHVHSIDTKRFDNDSFQIIKNDRVDETSVHKKPEVCPSTEASSVFPESKTHSNISSAKENQQKSTSICPLCWKRFNRNEVLAAHLKTCATKHNMTTRQLLDAMELQQKQTSEREALGLPGLPTNQAAKKSTNRKDSGSTDANLQLALALSVSMQEAEEQNQMQEENMLLEAGLGDEVVAKQMTLLERFGFTNNRPALPSHCVRSKSGKQKLKAFPTLLTRTKDERDRRITEKVALLLMGEEGTDNSPTPINIKRPPEEPVMKSEALLQYHKKRCDLWYKASASPTNVDSSSYYVDGLTEFISPSKVVAGSKLKHLSQVPCRIETPAKEFHYTEQKKKVNTPKSVSVESPLKSLSSPIENYHKKSFETSPVVNKTFIKKLNFSPSPHKQSNTSGFAETLVTNWRSIMNKRTMSDVTICVKDGNEIPAHELVLFVRCPSVLDDVIEELDQTTNMVSKKILWSNISHRMALAFLEFVYCGSVNKILGLSEGLADAQWLAQKYTMTDLEQHLKMIVNVRAKVCLHSDSSHSPQSMKHAEPLNVTQGRMRDSRTEPDRNSSTPSRTDTVSPSLITPKYKSPCKRSCKKFNSPSMEDKSSRRSSASSIERSLSELLPVDLSYSEDGEKGTSNSDAPRDSIGCRSNSPDPFSDSRFTDGVNSLSMNYDKEDGQQRLSQESQNNIDCLLSMVNKISSSQNQTQMDSHVSDKDTLETCISPPILLITDYPQEVVEKKKCPSKEHFFKCLPSPVAEGAQNFVLGEENNDCHKNYTESHPSTSESNSNSERKSIEYKRKCSFHSGDDHDSAKKKFCHDSTSSIKKNLFGAPTSGVDTIEQEQNNEIMTFDLTQSSDEGSRHSLSSVGYSPNKRGSPLNKHFITGDKGATIHVQDNCLNKIKDMIASDMSFKSDHEKSIGEDVFGNNWKSVKADDRQSFKYNDQSVNNTSVDVDAERLADFCADYEYDYFYSNYANLSPPKTPLAMCKSQNTGDRVKNESLNMKAVRRSLSQNDIMSNHSSPSPLRCLLQDNGNYKNKNLSCDISDQIICLDDSLSADLPLVPSRMPSELKTSDLSKGTAKLLSLNISAGMENTSLDAAKGMLEDSFLDQLNSSTVWSKEIGYIRQCQAVACSTPKLESVAPKHKTPIQNLTGESSKEVTPMLDYSMMKTPLLKKELHKFGLKPLSRRQAKLILRHIYNELHPWVPVGRDAEETNSNGSAFKEPDVNTRVKKSPTKRCLSKHLISPRKKNLEKCNSHSPVKKSQIQESEDLDSDSESDIPLSQSSVSSKGSDYITSADMVLDEPGLTQRDPDQLQTDLPTVVEKFIKRDPVLYQKVLLYEPIWLEQLHTDLKANKFKFKLPELMSYLDEQCITFRTAQQQTRNRARRTPKKKSKVTKLTQKENTKRSKCKAVSTHEKRSEDSSNS